MAPTALPHPLQTLLEKLFFGAWDDDILVVPPGATIAARNDTNIIAAE